MTATHNSKITTKTDVLYVAFELGESDWKLAFTVGMGQKPRLRSMPARDLARLHEEIAKAKQRFQLPADAPVPVPADAPVPEDPAVVGRPISR